MKAQTKLKKIPMWILKALKQLEDLFRGRQFQMWRLKVWPKKKLIKSMLKVTSS